MTIINAIADSLAGRSESLQEHLKALNVLRPKTDNTNKPAKARTTNHVFKNKKFSHNDEDEQFEPYSKELLENNNIGNNEPTLKRKRKLRFDFAKIDEESSIDEDVKEIQRNIQNKEKTENGNVEKEKLASVNNKIKTNVDKDKVKKESDTDTDLPAYKAIDDVIEKMLVEFPDKTREEIFTTLKAISFNIPNTYQYLADKETYSSK